MLAKRFFYVSAGLLCLAAAYHFGATSATAQSGSVVTGIALANVGCNGVELFVFTSDGEVFRRPYSCGALTGSASPVGNYWDAPTPAQPSTLGAIKARYR